MSDFAIRAITLSETIVITIAIIRN